MAPPAGGDQNRGPELVAVTWVFTALASFVVIVRLFTRVKILKETGLDDIFTSLSLVGPALNDIFQWAIPSHVDRLQILILVCTAVITASVGAGMGRHGYDLSSDQKTRATKLNYIATPFSIMAYTLPNLSVAIFLQRILRLPRLQKWLLYSVPIAQCMIAGVCCILLFAQCTPSRFLWNPATPAKCLPATVLTRYSYFAGGAHLQLPETTICR